MEENVIDVVESYLRENFKEIVTQKRKNFIGCKFNNKDKFYICYVSYFYGKFALSFRNNINEHRVNRERINDGDIFSLLSRLTEILNISISNKPSIIISKERKRIKNNKKLVNLKNIEIYKDINLYELNIQPYVYIYLISKGIITVKDFLLYDFKFQNNEELLKSKIEDLKNFLTCPNKYIMSNYKFLLKSSFKDSFTNEEYERYVDFGLCVCNLTYNLVCKICSDRNSSVFLDYMNLVSKSSYTFRDLGEKYNISFGRVRDIINLIVKKLKNYREEYVLLFNDVIEEDVLNYFIIGVIAFYNKNFLKVILDILDLDIFDSVYYRTQFFVNDIKNNKIKENICVNELRMFELFRFPLSVKKSNRLIFNALCKMRNVDRHSEFTGEIKVKKSKEVLQYESLTERRIIYMLNSCSFAKEIKTQSFVIPFQNYGESFEYYPDIQVLTNDKRLVIIEVKPLIYMMDKDSIFKYNLLKDYANRFNYAYAFIDDRYNSFDDILEREVSVSLEKEFLSFVKERRYVNYRDYKFFKNTHKCDLSDMVSIVIRNQNFIEFTARPFKFRYKYK